MFGLARAARHIRPIRAYRGKGANYANALAVLHRVHLSALHLEESGRGDTLAAFRGHVRVCFEKVAGDDERSCDELVRACAGVQGAYETPIANECDVSKSYGYSVKDGRREPSTNPLAPELCLALGAKSAAEMEAVASIGPQGAARMLDVLEGCRGARFKRRSNAEDDEAARSGGACRARPEWSASRRQRSRR